MHNVTATPASLASPRMGPLVKARDTHPGDVMQQCDWSLHVREITVSQTVAITVSEFGFPLHYAADTSIQLVACRAEQEASDPPAVPHSTVMSIWWAGLQLLQRTRGFDVSRAMRLAGPWHGRPPICQPPRGRGCANSPARSLGRP